MIKIKNGVVFHPETFSNPNVARIVTVTAQEAPEGYHPTITSAFDSLGLHSPTGTHPKGRGIDWRVRDFPHDPGVWANRIQNVLGNQYRVILKDDPPHLHTGYYGA